MSTPLKISIQGWINFINPVNYNNWHARSLPKVVAKQFKKHPVNLPRAGASRRFLTNFYLVRSAFCAILLYVGVIPYIVGRYVLTSWVNWHWIAGLLLNRNRTTNTNIPIARYCFLMLTKGILLSLDTLISVILYAACYVF